MFAFIATLAQAGGIIIDKIILTRRRVETHVYIPVLFLFLAFLTGLFMPFLGRVAPEAFELKNILFFLAMIVSALVWNIFYYKGAQKEKVQEFELIIMFQPLLTIFLAAVFIEKNINVHIFIASMVAACALIFSHLKKMHLQMTDYSWGLIIAVFFISIEIIFQKLLLGVYSPVALYFFRTGILFIILLFIYRPRLSQVSSANTLWILSTSALGVLQMITKFYGFESYGVIYTSLILMLAPILVYILSTFMLHEKLKARTIISVVIILLAIFYATMFQR